MLATALFNSLVLITAPEEGAAKEAPVAEGPAPAPDAPKDRAKEWQVQVAPGAELFVFPWYGQVSGGGLIAAGPTFKLTANKLGWYRGFMIGGGPSLQYSYMAETREPKDKIHQFTLNGDMVVGGGLYEKFAVYAHLMLGLGVMSAFDGETQKKFLLPGARATAGVGGFGYITPKISLGALIDFGFPGIVDAMVTVGFHLGKK
jgi:hypothetical protein